jgi:hypothetical protein
MTAPPLVFLAGLIAGGMNAAPGGRSFVSVPALIYVGVPRSMKMGTTPSPCPYDAAARHALQSAHMIPVPVIWFRYQR